jgi:hypothetical protein
MARFTLERGHWYACEIIGDEFETDRCSYTPIKVFEVLPSHTGKREFKLDFHHANYPAGVQHKRYRLRTIERGKRYLLAQSLDHTPVRFLQIYAITPEWVIAHFPGMQPDRTNLAEWLERHG